MAPAAAEPEEGSHGTFRARCTMYGLLAAFEMTNYVTRLAIPYIVTFMVRDFSFSEQQRALLLNSFTPGYILTQIPAGWAIQRWGAKPVVSVNSLGIVAIMLSLPTVAARGGARAACACLILFGMLQSTFPPALWTLKGRWIPTGPERAWALLISSYGSTLAKNIANVVTPWLSGRSGWRVCAAWYGGAVAFYALLWQVLARERPSAAVKPPPATPTPAADGSDAPKKARPFGARQLILTPPTLANTFLHMQHDLAELQVMAFCESTPQPSPHSCSF